MSYLIKMRSLYIPWTIKYLARGMSYYNTYRRTLYADEARHYSSRQKAEMALTKMLNGDKATSLDGYVFEIVECPQGKAPPLEDGLTLKEREEWAVKELEERGVFD